ncbi:MAG TPA: hypothetical protein VIC55_08030 [Gemmatimonadaceae bacterium]
MTWSAVVAALDDGDTFRSRVSVYLHPLAGRPIVWHVVRALEEASPAPCVVRILHRAATALMVPEGTSVPVVAEATAEGQEWVALRAAVTAPGLCVLVDGAAPLISPSTISRLLRAGEGGGGIAGLPDAHVDGRYLAVGGEGPALASAEDPRQPVGAVRIAPTSPDELIRVVDRHTLSDASVALRNRLVRRHEAAGVSFVLPATTWIDADVRIGADSVIYPGAVLEGQTEIGSECVIGPYTRIVDASIGRGAELKGWNYVARTSIRNHAVLEPYVRRGFD